MNKIKDFFVDVLGGAGAVLYHIIMVVVAVLPFLFINIPIWGKAIAFGVVYFIPYLTPIVWIWGLISAITSPQYWFSYVYYVVFVLYVIMFLAALFRKD